MCKRESGGGFGGIQVKVGRIGGGQNGPGVRQFRAGSMRRLVLKYVILWHAHADECRAQ
jgi:hypothetical protein